MPEKSSQAKFSSSEKVDFARRMRRNPTKHERMLWVEIQDSQLGVRFVRQFVIFGWIADFYCHEKKIAIELDGSSHDRVDDGWRDLQMARAGIRTLRFTNSQIENDMTGVLQKIEKAVSEVSDRTYFGGILNPKHKPIGIHIKRLMKKGVPYREALAIAFKECPK